MKKIIILLIAAIVLTACSSSTDEKTLPFDIDLDRVKEVTVNTFYQVNTFEMDEKWTEFVKGIANFNYKSASVSEVDEVWALSESEEDYYGVTLNCEDAVYSFLIFDGTVIANYINMSSDENEEPQFFIAKDDDLKTLQEELSELKLSSKYNAD